jgi:Fic/DOC family protein
MSRLLKLSAQALMPFVAESNRIEGINRLPTDGELLAHQEFEPTIEGLRTFTQRLDPGIELRELKGLNVRVGSYYPPPGGPAIRTNLEDLLLDVFSRGRDPDGSMTPFELHQEYEHLHPFTDGNGRSGRALWLWHMFKVDAAAGRRALEIGFLHTWYYQSLADSE